MPAASVVLAFLLGTSPQASAVPPAPSGTGGESDGGRDEAPAREPAEPALVDPWASVPVQTVVPTPPVVVQPVTPRSPVSAPLLDPWAGAARRHVPRQLDPELRDPFQGMWPRHEGPRIARADLRDPFARRAGPAETAAEPVRSEPARAAEPPDPGMPMHPDLRDPFGRRKARPTPPPPEAAPGPAPRPPAPPSLPPREPSGELLPGAFVPRARAC